MKMKIPSVFKDYLHKILNIPKKIYGNIFTAKRIKFFIFFSLICVVLIAFLFSSIIAYISFYRYYIPKEIINLPIEFQHTKTSCLKNSTKCIINEDPNLLLPPKLYDVPIFAGINLNNTGSSLHEESLKSLKWNMNYKLTLNLLVPLSPHNKEIGNFMIGCNLYKKSVFNALNDKEIDNNDKQIDNKNTNIDQPIFRSRVSSIIPYSSYLVSILNILFYSLFLVLGLKDESVKLSIVFGKYIPKYYDKPDWILLYITNPIQIYNASLEFKIIWTGLRGFIYNHYIISAILGISFFFFLEIIACFAIFLIFYFSLNEKFKKKDAYPNKYQNPRSNSRTILSEKPIIDEITIVKDNTENNQSRTNVTNDTSYQDIKKFKSDIISEEFKKNNHKRLNKKSKSATQSENEETNNSSPDLIKRRFSDSITTLSSRSSSTYLTDASTIPSTINSEYLRSVRLRSKFYNEYSKEF